MSRLVTPVACRDRTAALLTQHGKEQMIGPVLEAAASGRVQRVSGHDIDLLHPPPNGPQRGRPWPLRLLQPLIPGTLP